MEVLNFNEWMKSTIHSIHYSNNEEMLKAYDKVSKLKNTTK